MFFFLIDCEKKRSQRIYNLLQAVVFASGRCGRRLSLQRGWRTKQQSGKNDSACWNHSWSDLFWKTGGDFPLKRIKILHTILNKFS